MGGIKWPVFEKIERDSNTKVGWMYIAVCLDSFQLFLFSESSVVQLGGGSSGRHRDDQRSIDLPLRFSFLIAKILIVL